MLATHTLNIHRFCPNVFHHPLPSFWETPIHEASDGRFRQSPCGCFRWLPQGGCHARFCSLVMQIRRVVPQTSHRGVVVDSKAPVLDSDEIGSRRLFSVCPGGGSKVLAITSAAKLSVAIPNTRARTTPSASSASFLSFNPSSSLLLLLLLLLLAAAAVSRQSEHPLDQQDDHPFLDCLLGLPCQIALSPCKLLPANIKLPKNLGVDPGSSGCPIEAGVLTDAFLSPFVRRNVSIPVLQTLCARRAMSTVCPLCLLFPPATSNCLGNWRASSHFCFGNCL